MKRHGDPNGIRTRVTAVKGRCPRPLDDRVSEGGQYQNCPSLLQAIWRRSAARLEREEKLGRSLSCATMWSEHFERLPNECCALRGILYEGEETLLKLGCVLHFDCAAVFKERPRESCEVLHVRAEDDRLAGEDRLDRILAAVRGEALANKDDRRDRIPMAQFAGGIEDEYIKWTLVRLRGGASPRDVQTERNQRARDLVGAFHVSRRNDQQQVGHVLSHLDECARENFLFAGMRAATEQNRPGSIDA